MSTPVRRGRTLRSRLLATITGGANRLRGAWGVLARAQQTLLSALRRIIPGQSAIPAVRTALAEFYQALATFERDAYAAIERWAATDLPLVYREGAWMAVESVGRQRGLFTWTPRHQAAITALTAQYYADLMYRLQQAVRRAQAFARAALDAARDPATASQFLAAVPREHPLDTVIYANQARYPAHAWALAALTWQAVTTANAGTARTTLDELRCNWLEVRDGSGCGWESHDDSDRADGSLRTVQDALAHPTAHAHCVREFLPRPDIIGALV